MEGAAPAAPSAPTGSGLDLIGLTKVFPGGTVAVDDVNLHVDHGEYVVLLGPSGCGKTTTLRMIGGHEYPTEGDIVLDGESLVDLPPHKRPTTTVFQHFALFPHRSVLDNVAFGLKMEGIGQGGAPRQGDRGPRHGRAHRAPGPQARGAVRGPAAARRARARARDQAQGAAASTSRSETSTGCCSCACASSCGTSSASSG
jgi:ABC-type sugar transport system ATPase subunit